MILLCYSALKKSDLGMIPVVKPSKDKVQTTIYLPQGMHTELRITALNEHISMMKCIIRAIQCELEVSRREKENDN